MEQAVRPKLDSTYISGQYVDKHEDGHVSVKLNIFQHILINSRVLVSSTTTSEHQAKLSMKKCFEFSTERIFEDNRIVILSIPNLHTNIKSMLT